MKSCTNFCSKFCTLPLDYWVWREWSSHHHSHVSYSPGSLIYSSNWYSKLFFPSHFPSSKYFLCYRKTMQWATWCFLKFFWHFWLWAYSFLSEPGCWTLKSWVFWVNEKRSLSEPKKLKISVWSIQVNWENCKGTTKNKRKTEENSGCSLHSFIVA